MNMRIYIYKLLFVYTHIYEYLITCAHADTQIH